MRWLLHQFLLLSLPGALEARRGFGCYYLALLLAAVFISLVALLEGSDMGLCPPGVSLRPEGLYNVFSFFVCMKDPLSSCSLCPE